MRELDSRYFFRKLPIYEYIYIYIFCMFTFLVLSRRLVLSEPFDVIDERANDDANDEAEVSMSSQSGSLQFVHVLNSSTERLFEGCLTDVQRGKSLHR